MQRHCFYLTLFFHGTIAVSQKHISSDEKYIQIPVVRFAFSEVTNVFIVRSMPFPY